MTTAIEDAKTKAATTYNAAADRYDDAANSFWERFGRATVERLGLSKGATVLDVCCGSGASALPAAEIVGFSGRVLGIDLAERMLENARYKARSRGLGNVTFKTGDMLHLHTTEHFDAVVCVFGIFFVPDIEAAARSLWNRVRPGGKLAVTTWGPRWLEPATSFFWESIRNERPDLYKGFNPWDRICDPESLDAVLKGAGIQDAEIVAEANHHPIQTPDAWWSAVLGTGYRGTVEQLDEAAFERVRKANLDYIRDTKLRAVEANVVYAIASKPR